MFATLNSCEDDTSCRLKIFVTSDNSTKRMPNINVHVGKENGSVTRDGITDANGEVFFTFDLEAILDVDANYTYDSIVMVPQLYDTIYDTVAFERTGKSTTRLKPGELVEIEVRLGKPTRL